MSRNSLGAYVVSLPAGVGLATARAVLKLWLGFSPRRSGVYSAGNGPAMRSPVLGVCFGDRPEPLRALVRACTRVTHRDPKAEHGALAVALAAHLSAAQAAPAELSERFLGEIKAAVGAEGAALVGLLERAAGSAAAGEATDSLPVRLVQSTAPGFLYRRTCVNWPSPRPSWADTRTAFPFSVR